jgi:hypothetical protein
MEMAQIRKTVEELIAEEKQKSEQSKARMAELKARQRAEERKKDTHRKIVAGAILIARVNNDPRFRRVVQEVFDPAVTDPKHRAVIADLLDEKAFDQARMAAADKAAIEAKEKEVAAAEKPTAPVGLSAATASASAHPPGAVARLSTRWRWPSAHSSETASAPASGASVQIAWGASLRLGSGIRSQGIRDFR